MNESFYVVVGRESQLNISRVTDNVCRKDSEIYAETEHVKIRIHPGHK
jgi:hypothetical protein